MSSNVDEMKVMKRDKALEVIQFDKILKRVKNIGDDANLNLSYSSLVMKVIDQLYDGIPTSKIDELTAQQCATLSMNKYDYSILASRIILSNHQKNTETCILKITEQLYNFKDINGVHSPLVSKKHYENVKKHYEYLNSILDFKKDYNIDYFGFKTLERAYLMKVNNNVIERPQHMFLRVALCIHESNMEKVKETYDLMSDKYFIHATPTLYNAGTPRPQLSSCYLLSMENDSIDGIYNTLKECAQISKWAGGIGLHIHNIRACGTHIRGTNGTSNGIVPMLRVFNNTARYVDQGGGKRNGSFAIYLEPWHADIESFLDLKKNHGDEEMRARDLFYALWVPGLFMEKMKSNEDWYLFCPDKCPGLSDVYGKEFKVLYEKYVKLGRYNKVMKARDLWFKILDSQMETGTPYLLFKDACNEKSNQKNLGTIKSSNLCTEIVEYSDDKETAVCNLASIGLSKFVRNKTPDEMFGDSLYIYTKTDCKWCTLLKELLKEKNIIYEEILVEEKDYEKFKEQHNVTTFPQVYNGFKLIGGYDNTSKIINQKIFDYDKLQEVVKVMVQNLNNIININYYPNDKTRRSNLCHRPIGLGVQGLADAFILMDIAYESDEAQKTNKYIFETIYYAALEKSYEISKNRGPKLKVLFDFFRQENINFVSDNPHENELNKDLNDYEDKSYLELYEELKPIYAETKLEFSCNGAYSSFTNSPASVGILQFDMWNIKPEHISSEKWNTLKQNIMKFGLRNSLLVAPMPTASTSQILGNNECFEPFTSNIYTRRTLAGEFICVNKYLIQELTEMGLWNEQVKNNIIANKGSVQYIDGLDDKIKEKYKIVWEIQQKQMINMARDRGAFICQSQSLNLWMEDPNYNMLTKMHYYSYSQGLKTGIYYLRRKPKHQPQQFTIQPDELQNHEPEEDEICEMCSA